MGSDPCQVQMQTRHSVWIFCVVIKYELKPRSKCPWGATWVGDAGMGIPGSCFQGPGGQIHSGKVCGTWLTLNHQMWPGQLGLLVTNIPWNVEDRWTDDHNLRGRISMAAFLRE